MRKHPIDIIIWSAGIFFLLIHYFRVEEVQAFTQLQSGFESITTTYLIPLSSAVAGAAFILYVVLSYFKQEEYSKKLGGVIALLICSSIGLELIKAITDNFGGP